MTSTAHSGKSTIRHSGFTLVELLVTLSIAAVMMSIGMPSLVDFIKNQAVGTASFDVTSTLVMARSEAIKRNTNVVVTPTTSNWKDGWAVTVTSGGTTTTLGRQAAYSSAVAITSSVTSVTYGGNGRVQGTTVPTFAISGSSRARCVSVSLSGLPNSKTGAC